MTREELLRLHLLLTENARELMELKNKDYGGDTDPFKNFRRYGLQGINVRLSDKLARLDSFVEKGILAVKNESVRDTLIDIINYAVLFAGYMEDSKATPK